MGRFSFSGARTSLRANGGALTRMAYQSRLQSPAVDKLFDAVLSLKDHEDCYRFFEDLCTVAEIQAMAQRLQVAAMLYQGETYEKIVQSTGMSTATISRIKRFLQYGSDGYLRVLQRILPS